MQTDLGVSRHLTPHPLTQPCLRHSQRYLSIVSSHLVLFCCPHARVPAYNREISASFEPPRPTHPTATNVFANFSNASKPTAHPTVTVCFKRCRPAEFQATSQAPQHQRASQCFKPPHPSLPRQRRDSTNSARSHAEFQADSRDNPADPGGPRFPTSDFKPTRPAQATPYIEPSSSDLLSFKPTRRMSRFKPPTKPLASHLTTEHRWDTPGQDSLNTAWLFALAGLCTNSLV